jgi:hypothetical protein
MPGGISRRESVAVGQMLAGRRAPSVALALLLPVAAVLYIGCEAVSPRGTDQLITTTATAFRLLAIAGRNPAQL